MRRSISPTAAQGVNDKRHNSYNNNNTEIYRQLKSKCYGKIKKKIQKKKEFFEEKFICQLYNIPTISRVISTRRSIY